MKPRGLLWRIASRAALVIISALSNLGLEGCIGWAIGAVEPTAGGFTCGNVSDDGNMVEVEDVVLDAVEAWAATGGSDLVWGWKLNTGGCGFRVEFLGGEAGGVVE